MDDTTENGRHKATAPVRDVFERISAEPVLQLADLRELELTKALLGRARIWRLASIVAAKGATS